jgi:hypothetical protein
MMGIMGAPLAGRRGKTAPLNALLKEASNSGDWQLMLAGLMAVGSSYCGSQKPCSRFSMLGKRDRNTAGTDAFQLWQT